MTLIVWALSLAGVGLFAVVALVLLVAGRSVTTHANHTARAIEAAHHARKEISQ